MLDEFKAWVLATLGADWVYSLGMWVDRPEIASRYICSIQRDGGPGHAVDVRRPRYRVVLLGPAAAPMPPNGGGTQSASPSAAPNVAAAHAVGISADLLISAAIDGLRPCGAARVGALTEPVGPGYTTEGRPWYALAFELIL